MPLDTALESAEQFRRALLSKERQAAVRLVRAYGGVYQRLQSQIEALTAELDRLAEKGELSAAKAGRLARLKNLEKQIAEEVTRYGAVVEAEMDAGARAAVAQAQRDAAALTQAALPGLAPVDAAIMAQWQQLNPAAVESLLGFLADDSPLRQGLRDKLGPAVAERVSEKLVEGIALGYNPRKVAKIIRDELGAGLDWSLRTARTAQLYSYREATRASYIANQDIVPRWQWRSARDERTCASCIAMDGTTHPVTERLADHWNGRCLAPGMLVSGPAVVAFVARYYKGDLVTIRTSSGQLLTVTPNHPVLTDAGWVAAGLLKEGDNVIRYTALQRATSAVRPDKHHMPTRIEDIPATLGMVRLTNVPTAAEDFHGDGKGSEVHVVWADSLLWDAVKTKVRKPVTQKQLRLRAKKRIALPCLGVRQSSVHGLGATADRSLGGEHNGAVLFGSTTSDQQTVGGDLVSQANASPFQSDPNCGPAHTIDLGQCVLRFALKVGGGNGGGVEGVPVGPNNNTVASQEVAHSGLADTESGRQLAQRLAGKVALDRIVKISTLAYSGHVYNLQTTDGYYIANGIVTHNCAMVPVPVTYRELGLDVDEPPSALGEPTGEAWLRAQPESTQKAILGPGKWQAWTEGKFDFAQLSKETPDAVWGTMRVEAPLKELVPETQRKAA